MDISLIDSFLWIPENPSLIGEQSTLVTIITESKFSFTASGPILDAVDERFASG